MEDRPSYLDDIEKTQDEIAFKRITAWELRRMTRMGEVLTEQLNALEKQVNAHKPAAIPWWVQAMLAVMITLCGGYITIVHNMALANRQGYQEADVRIWAEVSRIAAIQHQRTAIGMDIEDLKRRIAANEAFAYRVPHLERQMQDINSKLDRIIERQWPRGGELRSPEGVNP